MNDETARWWLALVIDCRTKIILGMKLTRNPRASAARECLRMVVSDKGEWSGEAGGSYHWHHAVKPEMVAADNGPAFKSEVFTNTCIELGIAITRTIASLPGMRGTIERMFGTISLDLMPRLVGRTFSNPRERGDYKSEDRACLDAEDFAWVLVRWVVDIYHNTPHAGLGGLTPTEQWDADMESGNYPLSALPDQEQKRLAFGKCLERKLSPEGIVIMGIRYHSPEVGHTYIEDGRVSVSVRWDQEDLGAISVFLNGAWRKVPAVHERFSGMNLHVWTQVRKTLRAKSASRKAWNAEVVFRAIDQIEELVAEKSLAFGLIDTSVSDAEMKHIEDELFSNFRIDDTCTPEPADHESGRVIPPREPDAVVAPRGPSQSSKRAASGSVQGDVAKHNTSPGKGPAVPTTQKKSAQKLWAPRKSQEKNQ